MRRQHSIAALVYHHLYPNPTPADPPDFPQHLIRHLITEVRIETQRFYGGLDTIEAKYPGLNYSYPPHRKRLSNFPHHARLFRAFDDLQLTPTEISDLCKWEGTLWARQRYERDEGIKVIDTTGNDVRPYVERRRTRPSSSRKRTATGHSIKVKTDIQVEIEDVRLATSRRIPTRVATPPLSALPTTRSLPHDDDIMEIVADSSVPSTRQSSEAASVADDGSETDLESVSVVVNHHLPSASSMLVDPTYDAYVKEEGENVVRRASIPGAHPQLHFSH